MKLEWETRPVACGGKGTAEANWGEYSIGEARIGPGETISGEVPLDLYLPELEEKRANCEVVLRWTYRSGERGELVLSH